MSSTLPTIGKAAACAVLAATVASTSCSRGSDRQAVFILCGNSFQPPMNELAEQFTNDKGIPVITTIGGSEELLPQVQVSYRGDIFITHDPFLDKVKEAGALTDSVHVGYVAPVLAVAKGNPRGIKNIEDLAQPGLRVALTDPLYSTCGEMVFALLETKGIKDAVLKNVGNRLTRGHAQVGTFLQTDAVDAGILWNGVAHTFRDSIDIIPTAYEYETEIRVHVIGLSYSKKPAWVQAFLAVAREHGARIFAAHGYTK